MIGTRRERREELEELYPRWERQTIWQRFEQNAGRFAEREFLIFEGSTCTYGEAYRQVNETARALLALGVRPGDHVAVLFSNSPEYIFLTFALAKLGAVRVPVNTRVSRREIRFLLNRSDALWLFTDQVFDDRLLRELPLLKGCVWKGRNRIYASEKLILWEQFMRDASLSREEEVRAVSEACQDHQALCDIMFTSGSTSEPKGVLLCHDMLLRTAYATCMTRGMEIGRRIMIPLPLFHLFAYVEGLLAALTVGGAVIMSAGRFSVQNTLNLMRSYGANDIICVSSTMINLLEKGKPSPEQYPHLHAGYWASSCPDWVWYRAKEAFGIQDITTGYGMTECGSTTTMTRPENPVEYVIACHGQKKLCGRAGEDQPGGRLMEIRICDRETGEELPAGRKGEIQCRGVVVTRGYYRNEEAGRSAFTAEGWFKTGDMGVMDAQQNLTFLGRCDDMYKINGENVSPQYLDRIIGQCPLVKAVETVGIRSRKYGAVGVAFVEAFEEEGAREAIEAYCRENLASYQCPRYFVYGDSREWPRTGSGKIRKAGLREQAEEMFIADDK